MLLRYILTWNVRYRRDVGDTLINAYAVSPFVRFFCSIVPYSYYVLRDDMLSFYVNDIMQGLSARQAHEEWNVSSALPRAVYKY